jgi:hypothetical protein
MSSGNQPQSPAKSGFAGLGSMASDVDAVIRQAEESANKRPSVGSSGSSPAPSQRVNHEQPPAQETFYSGSPKPTGAPSAKKWLLGLGAAAAAIWLLSTLNNQPPQRRSPEATTRPSTEITIPRPDVQASLTEERPPFGSDQVLGPAQLRYCLAEEIRLEGARSALNNYVEWQVNRFNAMINDYNGRCSRFRYRRGALESARAEVERYRIRLEAEGRSRF